MHLERMLARLKKSTPQKLPNAERLCAAGAVSEWVRTHVDAGGSDPRTTLRSELIRQGAPLQCGRKLSARGGMRASIAWANDKLRKDKERGISRNQLARRVRQRELVRLFREQPNRVRRKYEKREADSKAAKKQRMKEVKESEERADQDARDFRGRSLGLASKDHPISIDVARRTVMSCFDRQEEADALPGSAAICKHFRKYACDKFYVRDAGHT